MRFISVSIYLLSFAKDPFESGCKSTNIFFNANTFLEKNEKGKTKTDSAFFKLLIVSFLCNCFLLRNIAQSFDEEVPEGLDALDEQGFVG